MKQSNKMENYPVPTREYFLDHSPLLSKFLKEKQIDGHNIINDSDILVVKLQCYNDTAFAVLMLEYAKWLVELKQNVNP
jgi:hypothetical protein